MAKDYVGSGGIRIQSQRFVCLGFRPIEVLEDCGPRRDKSRKWFVGILFNRQFRILLRKRQRGVWIIAPAVLLVQIVCHA